MQGFQYSLSLLFCCFFYWFKFLFFFFFKKQLSGPCNRQTGYQSFGFQTWQHGQPMIVHEKHWSSWPGAGERGHAWQMTCSHHSLHSQPSGPLHTPLLLPWGSLLRLPRKGLQPPCCMRYSTSYLTVRVLTKRIQSCSS